MIRFFIDVFKEVVGAFKEYFDYYRKKYPREKVVQIVACGIFFVIIFLIFLIMLGLVFLALGFIIETLGLI